MSIVDDLKNINPVEIKCNRCQSDRTLMLNRYTVDRLDSLAYVTYQLRTSAQASDGCRNCSSGKCLTVHIDLDSQGDLNEQMERKILGSIIEAGAYSDFSVKMPLHRVSFPTKGAKK